MAFELTGQTAVVTGAATGIGEAIARRLARAGAVLVVADVNLAGAGAVARSIGGESFPVEIDISRSASVEAAIRQVIEKRGRIDILVNNAGIAGKAAPLWEQSDQDWNHVIAVNLLGAVYCTRAVISHMRRQKYGRVVNIASIAGKEGNPSMSPYSSTKAAVIAFTKSVAKEVATEGICINSVAPAVIRTQILDQLTEEQVDYMTQRIPMRRTGTPDEIAAVVHFLASPDCSFVTGQCYDASGGRATY
jgi:NAD(P)-dependent dehydrogenase (short-subunit alcohol dehydrogenase family)